ncbi:MAG: PleD family two-component system response regulator [Rhodospirillaceae bacterium]|nr:PleD family two-component system response regulator [Rhodospirillaceae bacterium]
MTGRILVVDDQPLNVKLLEAKLISEYYDVLTANGGAAAVRLATDERPDLILLDVMMPDMDGYEVCRVLREQPETMHIPIVMVTTLSDSADRVLGLEAGADDFLTKPVDDLALFARVRSLLRFKVTFDELRLRFGVYETAQLDAIAPVWKEPLLNSRILLLEDFDSRARMIDKALGKNHVIVAVDDEKECYEIAEAGDCDAVIVSLSLDSIDGLRVVSQLRSRPKTRMLPILVLVEEGELERLAKALDLGGTDYVMSPIDRNELIARTRMQVRRKRYQDRLRSNLEDSVSMAAIDELTRLHNRRYLGTYLNREFDRAREGEKALSLVVLDVDHFKNVNDTHGHAVGDEVLIELARRMKLLTRSSDLPARYGGDEFVVVMPGTDPKVAQTVAERLRQGVADGPFKLSRSDVELDLTISVGVANFDSSVENPDDLFRRADEALYKAKNGGRNRVVCAA